MIYICFAHFSEGLVCSFETTTVLHGVETNIGQYFSILWLKGVSLNKRQVRIRI